MSSVAWPMAPERPRLYAVGSQPRSCTDTELLVGPIEALDPEVATAVEAWLLDHGVDVRRLILDLPVVREPKAQKLVWWESDDEGVPASRTFYRFGDRSVTWPAPFPGIVRGED